MDREQKAQAVAEITTALGEADAIFAVDYRGISVPQAAELRAKLREAETTFSVVKNRLAKRAVADTGTDALSDLLEGPTALAFVKGDPVTAAKAISTFAREHEILTYKGGLMDGSPLDPESFQSIARLPGLDVLHGQLVGLAASPLTGVVRGLGALMGGLAIQLGQISEKGLVGGAEESAAAEQPDEDGGFEEPAPGKQDVPADEGAEAEPAPAEESGEAEPEGEEPEPEGEEHPEPEQSEDNPAEPDAPAEDSAGGDSEEE